MLNLEDSPLSHCCHIPCIPGGSSRSAVKEVAPESRAKQALEYKVPQVSFQNALEKHTVVKMDCEGSEIPILLTEWDWKEVRLLVVEISVRKLRMDHPKGDGWKVLEKIFENLKKAGFQYARVEKRFFTPGYWDPESGNRNYMSDGIIWFLRPKAPVEFKDSEGELYSHWLNYKRIMETGGEVDNGAKPWLWLHRKRKAEMWKSKHSWSMQLDRTCWAGCQNVKDAREMCDCDVLSGQDLYIFSVDLYGI